MSDITLLLARCCAGEAGAQEALYARLYPELRRLARSQLARAGPITLDPTAIVHDMWLRCGGEVAAGSRGQFFAHASAVMRSVIVDHVRERRADKRGGGQAAVTLGTATLEALPAASDALQIDEALRALAQVDPRAHRLVELRYFGGLSLEEAAEVMALSVPTLKRDWRRARAFLFDQLSV
ncbi:MAG: sigma-70 family RNA polymerase sigma factor [Ideonella sp.]|nr:sigma-70 family RNA polymerase sigma factor [Ideonella sp.]